MYLLQQLCFSSLFHYFVSILHICLNIRDKNQKRFVTYLKGFLCFHVYVFFCYFFSFFLLIGEKVNTQWLSHAIFDPVVSWSYFFNLSFYSMILLFLFQCLFCVTWVLGVCFVNDDWVIFFLFHIDFAREKILGMKLGIVYVCVLGVNVLLLCSVVVAVKGLVLCNACYFFFLLSVILVCCLFTFFVIFFFFFFRLLAFVTKTRSSWWFI